MQLPAAPRTNVAEHPPRSWELADGLDDFDQLVGAVALLAGEADEFAGAIYFSVEPEYKQLWSCNEPAGSSGTPATAVGLRECDCG